MVVLDSGAVDSSTNYFVYGMICISSTIDTVDCISTVLDKKRMVQKKTKKLFHYFLIITFVR